MFNYLDVTDAVKIRINHACEKMNLKPIVVTKYSNRRVDDHLFIVICMNEEEKHSVWSYNSSTYLLFDGKDVGTISEAFILLGEKLK